MQISGCKRAKLAKYKKNHSKREIFLSNPFLFPGAERKRKCTEAAADLHSPPTVRKATFDSLCEDVVKLTGRKIVQELADTHQSQVESSNLIVRLQTENSKLKRQNKELKVKLAHHCATRCNQAIKMWRKVCCIDEEQRVLCVTVRTESSLMSRTNKARALER